MRWFQGGIAEAVATSKARNAIFVVFVEGKNDASKNAASVMDSVEVSSKLESEDFVAIKLDSGSEGYRQFAQIYQLVPVPSLFFIGGNGAPLEILAGHVNVPELLNKITAVLQKSGKVVVSEDASVAERQETKHEYPNSSPDEAQSLTESVSAPKEETTEVKNTTESQTNVPADAATKELTSEEKIERAKELIEKKRKQKQEEEEETQRQKEIERRTMMQDVQTLRKWQQDQELKQLVEERQKIKAEDAAARERVLKQIAEDRAERASRFSVGLEGAKIQAEEERKRRSEQQTQDTASKCDVARIQFRLPDGSSHSHNFEATVTLGEVRLFAATQLKFPFREFAMSTTFPRREFGANEDGQTLRDLQLVPTAVILILPASSGTVVSSSQSYTRAVLHMVWSLLTPVFSILNYIRNRVFGGGGGRAASSGRSSSGGRTTHQSSPPNAASTQSSTGARRRVRPTETTTIHREGNIHRLTDRQDLSDDENNTWNGNSTQQM